MSRNKTTMTKSDFLKKSLIIMKLFQKNMDYFKNNGMNEYHADMLDGIYELLEKLFIEFEGN